jgi:hypothetical protein
MAGRRFRVFSFLSCALLGGVLLAACSGPAPSATPGATATATSTPTVVPIATASGPSPTPLAVLPSPTAARPATAVASATPATPPRASATPRATVAAQRPADATSAIRLAYTTTSAVRSFRFTATTGVTVVGKSVPATTFTTTGEQVLPDRSHTTTSISGTSTVSVDVIETTRIGNDVYVHLPASIAPDGKDQWVLLDQFGSFFQDIVGASSDSQNPLDAVAILKDLRNVQTVGAETVNNASTTHYRGTVQPASAGQGNPIGDFINGIISRVEGSSTTVDVWVGTNDNLVRRVSIANSTRVDLGVLTRKGTPAATGAPTTQSTLTFDFTDFDATLSIAPPATFKRFSDLFGTLDPRKLIPSPATKPQV